MFHERRKHIKVDCHYFRDALQVEEISTHHVSTIEQVADIFTKALEKFLFHDLLCNLGICDLYALT